MAVGWRLAWRQHKRQHSGKKTSGAKSSQRRTTRRDKETIRPEILNGEANNKLKRDTLNEVAQETESRHDNPG